MVDSRDKGARFEREVVDVFRANGYPNSFRTSDGNAQRGRGDIGGGPRGCHFECKRQERLSVSKAFDQIRRDAYPLDMPVLIHRPSRYPIMATVLLDDLLPLLRLRES